MTTNLPVHLQRRALPEQLRYLAAKLADGSASPAVVALSLQVIADERPAESLGYVVARIDRQGQATLTSASVYELPEDAEHTRRQCAERGITGWSYTVCQVVPVPP